MVCNTQKAAKGLAVSPSTETRAGAWSLALCTLLLEECPWAGTAKPFPPHADTSRPSQLSVLRWPRRLCPGTETKRIKSTSSVCRERGDGGGHADFWATSLGFPACPGGRQVCSPGAVLEIQGWEGSLAVSKHWGLCVCVCVFNNVLCEIPTGRVTILPTESTQVL